MTWHKSSAAHSVPQMCPQFEGISALRSEEVEIRIEFGEMRLFVSWVGWHDVTEFPSLLRLMQAHARRGTKRGISAEPAQSPAAAFLYVIAIVPLRLGGLVLRNTKRANPMMSRATGRMPKAYDALGSITRADQIVVIGHDKQLPPRSISTSQNLKG